MTQTHSYIADLGLSIQNLLLDEILLSDFDFFIIIICWKQIATHVKISFSKTRVLGIINMHHHVVLLFHSYFPWLWLIISEIVAWWDPPIWVRLLYYYFCFNAHRHARQDLLFKIPCPRNHQHASSCVVWFHACFPLRWLISSESVAWWNPPIWFWLLYYYYFF